MRNDTMASRRKRSRRTLCCVATFVIMVSSNALNCECETTNFILARNITGTISSANEDPISTDIASKSATGTNNSSHDNYASVLDNMITKISSEEYNKNHFNNSSTSVYSHNLSDSYNLNTMRDFLSENGRDALKSQRNITSDHRELYAEAERYGWRKFSVVVAYSNPVYVPSNTNPIRQAGHIYVADEFVYNTKQNDNIGRMYQGCILLPPGGTADPNPKFLECVWQFELQLRSSQPGNLMLQGTFFEDGLPLNGGGGSPTVPDKQYFGIVGGTGAFTSVYGVARFKPLNLNGIPPTFCYTFYVKLG